MPDDDSFMPQADRSAPPDVAPLVRDGVRYERVFGDPGDPQVGGLIAAFDVADDRRLWTLVVFDNVRQPDLEGDVQDVFVSGMAFDDDGLLDVVDELGRRYVVDVKARTATPLD